METTTNNETTLQPSTQVDEQKQFSSRTADRRPIKQWGFEEAGVNRGDQTALESHLRWIQAGHVVDEYYDANEEMKIKKSIEDQITLKETEKLKKEKDEEHVNSVVITNKLVQIEKSKAEIDTKKLQLTAGKIKSTFNPARFWIYTILAIVISIYLIFFYASALNASFFRSMQQLVNNGSADDITLMLNSIFDSKGIFQLSPHLLFVYLGAFLFFGFGILPHIFHDGSKFQTVKIIAAIVLCFVIDSMIAYKIDSGIHELKLLMNIADPTWAWYKSVNFFLVLAFGFGSYLLWGFIYEAAIKEFEKKNVYKSVEVEIKAIERIIERIEGEIIECKKQVSELQKLIETLKIEIENLKKSLEKALCKPEQLLKNIENFYAGWLQYLNAFPELDYRHTASENVYRQFHNAISAQLN